MLGRCIGNLLPESATGNFSAKIGSNSVTQIIFNAMVTSKYGMYFNKYVQFSGKQM